MNLFGKIWGAERSLFRRPAPAVTPTPPPEAVTSPRAERRQRRRVSGAFGRSRGQKFDFLASPLGLQECPEPYDPVMLYNLRRAIPGHPAGSTVSRAAVEHVLDYQERGGRL
jgi:hypothetical protein